uniref:uncharacterized protein LOC122600723 n=1 Tax=Erigeron canadensis TaxID=72917 RepID=UPI001CB8E009|nr:uncharacterized protein LOC122600723 [Erigeron canadensis]
MDPFLKEFEHLRIPLKEIKRVTNNFRNKPIGSGGFGNVYEGELSHSKGRSHVAIKRLDRKFGQGEPEFWREIMMLFRYSHENLIPLLGFCDEDGEKVIVTELASNGSLESHLSSRDLTWERRIKICLDAAKGLSYLHDDKGTHQRVIHRDLKSANILLDDEWKAKVSDMGLAKVGPANQEHTALFTEVVGTLGYVDPVYAETSVLTKESDVYSFGVVLLEVLCGKLCNRNGFSVATWKKSYINKKTHEIIFQGLTQPMEMTSLEAFSDIAFQCVEESREKRPTMSRVVEQLEMALLFEQYRGLKLPKEYVIILNKNVATSLKYKSVEELKLVLSKGVLLDADKTWFSINDKGEHSVLISMDECLIREAGKDYEFSTKYNSRFPVGTYSTLDRKFKTRVRTQFLTPNITYTINLVYKNWFSSGPFHSEDVIEIEYKLDDHIHGETKTWTTYLGDHRGNGWYAVELYQFTSDGTPVNLDISFEAKLYSGRVVEGIEFQSMENVEEGQASDDHDIQPPPVSDSDGDIKDRVKWKIKELYSIFRQRFLIVDGSFFKRLFNNRKWYFLDKNGKKCLMISARAAFRVRKIKKTSWVQSENSRFGKVLMIKVIKGFPVAVIQNKIKYQALSPQTKYACYLVYKLPEDRSNLQMAPVEVRVRSTDDKQYVYLVSPQIPVIRQKVDEITHKPLFKPKIKGLPQQRSDAWMEVQVYEFHTTDTTDGFIPVLRLTCYSGDLEGLILQGVEIRPI